MSNNAEEIFAALYRREHGDVLRFVSRRIGERHAEDVTHETFLIAWRRLADIPKNPSDARAWLFTVARNCLLNESRTGMRQGALAVRIAETARQQVVYAPDEGVIANVDLATAWGMLQSREQETLSLTIWDELTSAQAGQVLGISGAAYRVRLLRARATLRQLLTSSPSPAAARAVQVISE